MDNASGRPGILDLSSGDTAWLDLGGRRLGGPQCSPDGDSLLWTVGDKATGDFGFTVIDVDGAGAHTGWLSHGDYDLVRPRLSWYPDGR